MHASEIAEILTVRFQSLPGLAGHGVSVPVVSCEVSAGAVCEVLLGVGVVGVVLVLLRRLLRAPSRGVRVVAGGVLGLAVVSGRDVSVSGHHLAVGMLHVPQRILNTGD